MHDVSMHQVAPELFARIKQAMIDQFDGREHDRDGEFLVKGVHVKYSYDGGGKCLTVSVLSSPQIVTSGYVIGQLYDAIDQLAEK